MTKSSAGIRMDLARGHVALGEHVEALACLERAVRESPELPGLLELIDELSDIWSQERERVACRAAADALREFLLGRSYRRAAPIESATRAPQAPAPAPAAVAPAPVAPKPVAAVVAAPAAAPEPAPQGTDALAVAPVRVAPVLSEAEAVAAFDAGHAEFRAVRSREELEDSLPEADADAELELDFEVPPEEADPVDGEDMDLAEAEPVDDVLLAGFPPVLRREGEPARDMAPQAEEELSFASPLPAARGTIAAPQARAVEPAESFEAEAEPEPEPELDLEAELDAVLRRRPQAASAPAAVAAAAPVVHAVAAAPVRTSAQRVADARVRELERWLVNLRERCTHREGAQA